ncbi:MAG: hypothetical protein WDZ76_08990, partial [Pseudohongiellaceae bacterium]
MMNVKVNQNPVSVAVLLHRKADRQLLETFIAEQNIQVLDFETFRNDPEALSLANLIVVDEHHAATQGEILSQARLLAEPVFLPFLITVSTS